MNHGQRNKQIRKEFEALQKRGWKVQTICDFLSEKDYPSKLSPSRIFDIVYRVLPTSPNKPMNFNKSRK